LAFTYTLTCKGKKIGKEKKVNLLNAKGGGK